MASKRKRRQAALDRRDAKKFFRVAIISVVVMLILLYLLYRSVV